MKKALLLLLTLILAFALTACDEIPGMNSSTSQPDSASVSGEGDSSSSGGDSSYEVGGTEGYLGDTMATAFFNFTVSNAQSYTEVNGVTPAEGNKYLVVDMTVDNTSNYSMPMFNGEYGDFQIQWGSGDEDYGWSLDEIITDEQLPLEYEIPISGSEEGQLIFEVPADSKDYALVFLEIYEDGSTGDMHVVYFTSALAA